MLVAGVSHGPPGVVVSDSSLSTVEARTNAYLRTGDARHVCEEQAAAEADALRRGALPSLSPRGLGRPPCQAANVLGWFYLARYTASTDPDDLADLALSLFLLDANRNPDCLPPSVRPVIGAEPDPSVQAHWAPRLVAFGDARADRYALTVGIQLLERMQAAAEDPVERGEHLTNLAHAHHALFTHTDLDEDLQASIDRAEQALTVFPDDHPYRAVPLLNLGGGYLDRFNRTGNAADLEDSIDRSERAARALPPEVRHRAIPLTTLGRAHRLLFERTGVVAHIDAAIDRAEQAVAASPADDPELSVRRSNLGRYHLVRYRHLGRPSDLDASIACTRQALAESDDPAQQALCRDDLAVAHMSRFERTGDPRDVDTAIELGEHARRQRPDDSTIGANLVAAYEKRFERTGRIENISTAIDHVKHALAVANGSADRADRLSSLGVLHQTRFRVLGEVADLDKGVDYGRLATEASPDSALYLANLVAALLLRFGRLGAPEDLHAALVAGRRSVAAAPPGGRDRPQCLSNLGNAYRTRYELTGDPADLKTGIELADQALRATPDGDSQMCGRLWNMAYGHETAFRQTLNPDALTPAIEYGEKALAATPPGHLDRGMYLASLGGMYRDRFVSGGRRDPADLDAAVEYGEQSVAHTPSGSPRRGLHLSGLGAAYASRFRITRAPADRLAAVERCEQALALTPPGHPHRAGALADLAFALALGPERPATDMERDSAARLSGLAVGLETSQPMHQVRAARAVGYALTRWGASADAARLYRTAVQALRHVAPHELNRAEREHRLGWHQGLVSEAIAAQLAVGDPGGAVEIAEMGRGVLLSATLDTRTEVTELDERCPDLAPEFHALRTALSAVDDRTGDGARRRDLAQRWSRHLDRIRRRPGFERFLEPPLFAELQRSATDGAVVLVSVAAEHGHAVVLHGDSVLTVPLPRLTFETLRKHGRALQEATRTTSLAGSLARGRVVPEVLAWLWAAVAGPTLDALGHDATPVGGRPWPRIWWVPTGAVSLFPLHAAGAPDGPAVIDRVVSSYTPTIRTLLHSRSRPRARTRRQLTVAVSRTPDLPDLQGAAGEARALHPGGPDEYLLLDDAATVATVTEALMRSTWVHLACHATTDPSVPSRGGLRLRDGTLTVSRISALRPESAELVYLSACSTAHGQGRQIDEAVHAASAFQLAGYRHVVATLWPVDDAVAADAARRFYDRLPNSPSADAAAHALHALAHDLRREYPVRPDLWAPFIHCGP